MDIVARGNEISGKKVKPKLSRESKQVDRLNIEDVKGLGGDESDIELVNTVDDDDEFETAYDELEADAIEKAEVAEFIAQLGIRDLYKSDKPQKKLKLKSAKFPENDDEKTSEPEDGTNKKDKKSADTDKKKKKHSKSKDEGMKSEIESSKLTKLKKLVQHDEVSSTTVKSMDFVANYKTRAHLLIKPGGRWSENRFDSDPLTFEPASPGVIRKLEQFASRLLDDETTLYRKRQEMSKKSSVAWLKTVLVSGTVADKTAALVLLIQEAPVHSLPSLESLIGMVKKGHREAMQVLDTLKELFLSDLLLENSKLKSFDQHPLGELDQLSSGNRDSHDKRLLMWYFESQLKRKYADFVAGLEALSHDTVAAVRKKATAIAFQLLAERSEQEKMLLSLLVNKLGDPDYKVAANTAHLLTKLVDQHSNMKMIVVMELERLLYRPRVSPKAQYYGICFLNQLLLSHDERQLASRLISIYFTFFKVFVKKGEVESKMLSALLTGVNRAYPYAKADRQNILSQVDTLYKIVHISPFSTSLHALMLLYQVVDASDSTSDRYYSALYRKLQDPALQCSNKLSLFLNLLFKSMKNDLMERRIQAFIKRLLQVCQAFSPPFICGALILLSEVLKARPSLLKLSKISQQFDDNDDDDEHFVDVDDDDNDDNKEKLSRPKTDRLSSWVHRSNMACRRGTYDPHHRNPLYCHAESECTWELLCLAQHYHPSVALFANSLLRGEYLSYTGDPLEDFTLMRFLDRFVYRNPKKVNNEKGPAVLGAGKPTQPSPSAANSVRRLPVNSDAYLQKSENEIPADESFFYRFFRQHGMTAKRREPEDEESGADEVSDDEFDAFLDKFEHGLEDPDIGIDFAADLSQQKTALTKKQKKQVEQDEASEDEDDDGDEDLSDEEVDFGSDFGMDLDDDDEDGPSGKSAPFDEEDVEFSGEEDDGLLPQPMNKKRKLSSRDSDGGLFAAADEFSHLIEDDAGSTLGMVGTSAVSRKDNAGAKQLKWEADRESWVNDRDWKSQLKNRKQRGTEFKKRPGFRPAAKLATKKSIKSSSRRK